MDLTNDFQNEQDLGSSFAKEPEADNANAPFKAASSAEPEKTGALEALGQGALRGASFGVSDRLHALLNTQTKDQDYDTALKDVRDYHKKLEAEHPYASTAGKIGGGVGSILLGGGLLGAGAKGLGMGAEAAGAAEALGLTGEAAGTLGGAVRGGATLGAAQGLGETEDYTNPTQVAKDVIEGAGGGALGGAVMTGAGSVGKKALSGIGKLGEMASQLPVIEEGAHAFKQAFNGETKSAPEAREVLSQGVEGLVKKVNDIQKHISDNYNKVYSSEININPESLQTLSPGTIDALHEISQSAEGKMTARDLDNQIKTLKEKTEFLKNNGTYDEYKDALNSQKELKGLLISSLDPESAKLLSLADKQNYLLSNARAKLNDMPSNLSSGAGTQEGQVDYQRSIKGITDDLISSSKGNAADTNKLQDAFDTLGKIEQSSTGLENPLTADTSKISDQLAAQAKDYRIAELGSKRSEFGGLSKGGYSLKSVPVHAGTAAGMVARSAVDTAQIPLELARNVASSVSAQDPEAANMIKNLSASADATAQKAGKLLQDIISDPDKNKRSALMFSLSQQPWFRDIVHKHAQNESEGSNGQ